MIFESPLILRNYYCYSLQLGGRRKYLKKSSSLTGDDCNSCYEIDSQVTNTVFEFDFYWYPPLLLHPHAWIRYNLTPSDVKSVLTSMDAYYIWQLSLAISDPEVDDIDAGPAFVKPTFQSLFALLFIIKKQMYGNIIGKFLSLLSDEKKSAICVKKSFHRPLVPLVKINEETFECLKEYVPEKFPSFMWTPFYSDVFVLQSTSNVDDILVVPIEYDQENDLIMINRIVQKKCYDELEHKPKSCVLNMPVNIVYWHNGNDDDFDLENVSDIVLDYPENIFIMTTEVFYVSKIFGKKINGQLDIHNNKVQLNNIRRKNKKSRYQ